jgi:hypothetical protein
MARASQETADAKKTFSVLTLGNMTGGQTGATAARARTTPVAGNAHGRGVANRCNRPVTPGRLRSRGALFKGERRA